MEKKIESWFSPALQKEMPIAIYGYYGFALLMIPTAGADHLEYERFELMQTLQPFIDNGVLKVYSINSINTESWMNRQMDGAHKAIRHNQFNEYVYNEVVPYIRNTSSPETFIYTCGASLGAFHAMNLFFKRPDIINGAIGMSGVYDLTEYTDGYWDEQVYYNSPTHYIPNLADEWYLKNITASHHIHLYTGGGNHEAPGKNQEFSDLLWSKGIWHDFELWGHDIHHDWPTWRMMLPYIIREKFS
jgi:esterase/lipase superfamily enzyme